ncbi:MAG: hypothetical protein C0501_13870 [Isosphaera sp.]|nr:hypothetical protein [Isosphaera sp.]
MLRVGSLVGLALTVLAAGLLSPDPRTGRAADPKPVTDKLNKAVEGVTLTGPDGKPVSLKDWHGKAATVVVFLSFDCPVSNSYAATLTEMHAAYAAKGVAVVGVVPGEDDRAAVAKRVAEFKLPFPVATDPKLAAADAFKATTTPEAFVLDHNAVLRYRGRVDNAWHARLKRNPRVTETDLKNAVEELLAGKDVTVPATVPVGCHVLAKDAKPDPNAAVTYHRDVLPILQKHCQSCHRPGEVGPFSLMTYKQAQNWSADMVHYTASREMPPWKPAAGVPFANARSLTLREIDTLAAWDKAGCPEGDPKDAPPPVKFPEGWQLGEPDLVLTVPEEMHVAAGGKDLFRCFVLPTNTTEDKYIVAYEVRPGNAAVVHHALNFFDTTGRARELEQKEKDRKKAADEPDRGPGYSVGMGIGFVPTGAGARPGVPPIGTFGGWAPGQLATKFPEGSGVLLPKGADVVLQVHYHRTGKAEADRTRIGVYFAKKPVEKPFVTLTVGGLSFFNSIPKGDPAYKAKGSAWLTADATVHSVLPHMHLVGRQIKVTMTAPGQDPVVLVDIKDWDYNWQETYWFKDPIRAKAGTRFDVEAVYDNSEKNPHNPFHPPRNISFGEETTNEMLFGFLGATPAGGERPRFVRTDPNKK